jgi:hypothetical protein
MTHNEAVKTVVKLAPAISERGAHSVLLEHAERESLAPAQLQKIAQLVNTTAVVSHAERSEDRGASFPLVDVPALVSEYIQQEKSAGRRPSLVESGDDWKSLDFSSMMRQDMYPQTEKAAAAVEEEEQGELNFEDLTPEQQKEAADVLYVDTALRMEEIFNVFKKKAAFGSLDIQRASRNARYKCNSVWVKRAAEFLANNLKRDVIIDDQPLVKRSFEVQDPDADLLLELADNIQIRDELRKVASGLNLLGDPTTDPGAVTDDEERPRKPGTTAEEDELKERMRAAIKDEFDQKKEERAAERERNAPPKEDDAKVTRIESDYQDPDLSRLDSVIGGAASGVKEVGKSTADIVAGAASSADSALQQLVSGRTNKAQMDLDNEVRDIQRSIRVRRLIANDPILRDADPRQVLDIYNSVVALNPEIADNGPALTLILREATSYDGVTMDSQKMLTDVRKNLAQSKSTESQNNKEKYSVVRSGASPAKAKA